jgi:hypothetical protein
MATEIETQNVNVPSYIRAANGNLDDFGEAGYPVISIKGKVFHLIENGEHFLLRGFDDNGVFGRGEPLTKLNVVIFAYGPPGRASGRLFYATGYQPNSSEKPTCLSMDGTYPDEHGTSPQAARCDLCPRMQLGSGATEINPKARACKSVKRLAVALEGNLTKPYLLRVPGASIIGLYNYLDALRRNDIPSSYSVVTEVSFDHEFATPRLKFGLASFLPESLFLVAAKMARAPLASRITGVTSILPDETRQALISGTAPIAPVTSAPVLPSVPPPRIMPLTPAQQLYQRQEDRRAEIAAAQVSSSWAGGANIPAPAVEPPPEPSPAIEPPPEPSLEEALRAALKNSNPEQIARMLSSLTGAEAKPKPKRAAAKPVPPMEPLPSAVPDYSAAEVLSGEVNGMLEQLDFSAPARV